MLITKKGTPEHGFVVYMLIAAGETVAVPLAITDVDGNPVNITGYTMKMRIDFSSPLDLTTGNGGITIVSAVGGTAQINIPDNVSGVFTPGKYPFDFWTISGGGIAKRWMTGYFTVQPQITPIP